MRNKGLLLLLFASCVIFGSLRGQNLMFTHNPSLACGTYTPSAYCGTCAYHPAFSQCTILPDVCFEDRSYMAGIFYGDNDIASGKRTGVMIRFVDTGPVWIHKGISWALVSGTAGQLLSVHLDELTWYPCQPIFYPGDCRGPECQVSYSSSARIMVITANTPGYHGYLYDLQNVDH